MAALQSIDTAGFRFNNETLAMFAGWRAAVPDTPLVCSRTGPGHADTRRGRNAIFVQEKDRLTPQRKERVGQFALVTEAGHCPIVSHGRIIQRGPGLACRDLPP